MKTKTIAVRNLQNLGLVNIQLLGMIDNKLIRRHIYRHRMDLAIRIAKMIQIVFLPRLIIGVVAGPDHARHVKPSLRAEFGLHRSYKVVTDIRVLHQLEPVVVLMGFYPRHDLAAVVQENRKVILAHLEERRKKKEERRKKKEADT
jgi:hypothetical protein